MKEFVRENQPQPRGPAKESTLEHYSALPNEGSRIDSRAQVRKTGKQPASVVGQLGICRDPEIALAELRQADHNLRDSFAACSRKLRA